MAAVKTERQPDIVLEETPGGRVAIYLEDNESVCPECNGKGRIDSCDHCGNRGYMIS